MRMPCQYLPKDVSAIQLSQSLIGSLLCSPQTQFNSHFIRTCQNEPPHGGRTLSSFSPKPLGPFHVWAPHRRPLRLKHQHLWVLNHEGASNSRIWVENRNSRWRPCTQTRPDSTCVVPEAFALSNNRRRRPLASFQTLICRANLRPLKFERLTKIENHAVDCWGPILITSLKAPSSRFAFNDLQYMASSSTLALICLHFCCKRIECLETQTSLRDKVIYVEEPDYDSECGK